jgi:hypothetical protein
MGTASANLPEPPARAAARRFDSGANGLNFSVARTLADVEEAWSLVHTAYVRSGAVSANLVGLYTASQALGPETLVMLARMGAMPVGTVTAILDNPRGLTLDEAYAEELAALRKDGRKLLELCLFADRRASISRSFMSVLELTRFMFYFARHCGATDFVTAVPADHVPFYVRYFAFERAGRRDRSPTLHGKPTSLLRLCIPERLQERPRPLEVDYYLEKPVAADEFEERYSFPTVELAGSRVERFMQGLHR